MSRRSFALQTVPAHWRRRLGACLAAELARLRRRYAGKHAHLEADLLAWGRRYLPAHFALPPSAMHVAVARALDGWRRRRGARLNVIAPRGSAKSTLVSLAYVLRAAVSGSEPYIWIVSDTQPQARQHLENLAVELTDNRRLRSDYPRATGRGSQWRAAALRLCNGVVVEAVSTGQRIRGRRQRKWRPSLIVCDDLQNDLHMESPRLRDTTRRWFFGALLCAGDVRTNVVHLATALHQEALAFTLAATPGWQSQTFRAVQAWPHRPELWEAWRQLYADVDDARAAEHAREFYEAHAAAMQEGADVLWPAAEDLYALMCQRAERGTAAFAREKQCEPLNPDLCEWPESYFGPQMWFDDWPDALLVRTLALDPSKGADAQRGDYSACVLLGIDAQGVVYVEADLARRPTPQIVADVVAHYRRFQPHALGVETNQFQHLLGAELVAELNRQGCLGVQPWAIENRVNKQVRIRRWGPLLAHGRVRFHRRSAGTRLLVEQMKYFPAADHDDGPDAAEMALRLAQEYLGRQAAGG